MKLCAVSDPCGAARAGSASLFFGHASSAFIDKVDSATCLSIKAWEWEYSPAAGQHRAFACYTNDITSWTVQARTGLLLPFSTSSRHLFFTSTGMFGKKSNIYIFSSQRHVKTSHADKRVPIELKATALLIPLTLAWASLWEFLVWRHVPSTFTTAKKKKKRKEKRDFTLWKVQIKAYIICDRYHCHAVICYFIQMTIKETPTPLPLCFPDSVLHLVT